MLAPDDIPSHCSCTLVLTVNKFYVALNSMLTLNVVNLAILTHNTVCVCSGEETRHCYNLCTASVPEKQIPSLFLQ